MGKRKQSDQFPLEDKWCFPLVNAEKTYQGSPDKMQMHDIRLGNQVLAPIEGVMLEPCKATNVHIMTNGAFDCCNCLITTVNLSKVLTTKKRVHGFKDHCVRDGVVQEPRGIGKVGNAQKRANGAFDCCIFRKLLETRVTKIFPRQITNKYHPVRQTSLLFHIRCIGHVLYQMVCGGGRWGVERATRRVQAKGPKCPLEDKW